MICHLCGTKVEDEKALLEHLEEVHSKELKKMKFTPKQSYYHHKNRFKMKRIGICGCGARKKWLEEADKYEYYCFSDECKGKMNQIAINNNIAKLGVAKPFELAEVQLKAMESRGKSMYVWGGGPGSYTHIIVGPDSLEENPSLQEDIDAALTSGAVKYVYLSSVEESVLKELIKHFDKDDIVAPFDEIITYTYPGQDVKRNHIPDIYVKSLDLIISCKDSMLHPNRHHNMVEDRFKSLFEYQAILNTTNHNFFQIDGEDDVPNLMNYIRKVSQMYSTKSRYIAPPKVDIFVLISESVFIDGMNSKFIEDITSVRSVIIGEHGVAFKLENTPLSIQLNEDGSLRTSLIEEGLVLKTNSFCEGLTSYDVRGMQLIEESLRDIVFKNGLDTDSILEELQGSVITIIGGDTDEASS